MINLYFIIYSKVTSFSTFELGSYQPLEWGLILFSSHRSEA